MERLRQDPGGEVESASAPFFSFPQAFVDCLLDVRH